MNVYHTTNGCYTVTVDPVELEMLINLVRRGNASISHSRASKTVKWFSKQMRDALDEFARTYKVRADIRRILKR